MNSPLSFVNSHKSNEELKLRLRDDITYRVEYIMRGLMDEGLGRQFQTRVSEVIEAYGLEKLAADTSIHQSSIELYVSGVPLPFIIEKRILEKLGVKINLHGHKDLGAH